MEQSSTHPKIDLVKQIEQDGIPLTAERIAPCLSLLQFTGISFPSLFPTRKLLISLNVSSHTLLSNIGDGLCQAYTKLHMPGMKIGNIDLIQNYKFLRHINLSNNMIRNIEVLGSPNLGQLLTLDLSKNRITDPSIAYHPTLQILNLSENNIETIPDKAFPHPFLTSLNLNGNSLQEINAIDDPQIPLRFFEARANKLQNCEHLNQNIEELDLVCFFFLPLFFHHSPPHASNHCIILFLRLQTF